MGMIEYALNQLGGHEERIDAITFLRMDHVLISSQLQWLLMGHGALRTRKLQFARLVQLLGSHARVEQEGIYPEVQRHPDGVQPIHACLAQHQAAQAVVGRMSALSPDDASWAPSARELARGVSAHIAFEQDVVLPLAKRVLSEHALMALGRVMREHWRIRMTRKRRRRHAGDGPIPLPHPVRERQA